MMGLSPISGEELICRVVLLIGIEYCWLMRVSGVYVLGAIV